jgi:hypothetical protein
MNRAVVILIVGVLLFLVSVTADTVGVGEGSGFGWKQITGAIVGAVVAAIGIIQMRKKKGVGPEA